MALVHSDTVSASFHKRAIQRLYNRLAGRVLLNCHLVHGPQERLSLAPTAAVGGALFNTTGGRIAVGDHSFFGHNVCVLAGRHDTDGVDLEERASSLPDSGCDIEIGRGVWLATNVTVLGPCRIGDGAVVAAGSVVSEDVPAGARVAGVPARVLEPQPA